MRLLLVHPSSLMYSEIFLRLEPLGLERVAGAAREAGHEVRVVDLQVFSRADLAAEMASFQPGAIGVSLNYLANVPEAIEIAAAAKQAVPGCFVFFGGHSVSFIAEDVLAQAEGSVDAVVRGEGETAIAPAARGDPRRRPEDRARPGEPGWPGSRSPDPAQHRLATARP